MTHSKEGPIEAKEGSASARQIHDDELYTTRNVSGFTKQSPKTLEAWRLKGYGPPYLKIGRLVRYRGRDIRQWLDASTRHSTSEEA